MSTLVGVIGGVVFVLLSFIMEGGKPAALINIPAFILVFGGTFAVIAASFSIKESTGVFKMFFGVAIKEPPERRIEIVRQLVGFSEKARREGLLVLEEDARQLDDAFMRSGIQLVVDGTDPELVKDIMEAEIEAMEARHKRNADVFKQAAGFAPTLGIIGTVLGLVHVLENLSQPSTLGPAISSAFLATFFGVFTANIFWMPVSNSLKNRSAKEVDERYLIVEGVLSIQSGDNPRVLAEKLKAFLPTELRRQLEEDGDAGSAPAAAASDESERRAA